MSLLSNYTGKACKVHCFTVSLHSTNGRQIACPLGCARDSQWVTFVGFQWEFPPVMGARKHNAAYSESTAVVVNPPSLYLHQPIKAVVTPTTGAYLLVFAVVTNVITSSISSYCNSFNNQVPPGVIYGYPIFKWVAVTWQWWVGTSLVTPDCQIDMPYWRPCLISSWQSYNHSGWDCATV